MIARVFGLIGRHAPPFLAVGVFTGLLLPDLAAAARPLLGPVVFVLLVLTLMRIDWAAVAAHGRRPAPPATMLVWILLAAPVAVWPIAGLFLPALLATHVTLLAACPPIISAPALALLLGLEAPIALVVMVTATLVVPLTLPPLALALLGLELEIGAAALMARLALLIGGALAVALVLRAIIGERRLAGWSASIDGLFVVCMVIFAVAVMDGVLARLLERPGEILGIAAIAFVANAGLQGLGALLFLPAGKHRALTAGFISGNRNMGILLAALPPAGAAELSIFVALVQLPIYILPSVLRPLYRRVLGEASS